MHDVVEIVLENVDETKARCPITSLLHVLCFCVPWEIANFYGRQTSGHQMNSLDPKQSSINIQIDVIKTDMTSSCLKFVYQPNHVTLSGLPFWVTVCDAFFQRKEFQNTWIKNSKSLILKILFLQDSHIVGLVFFHIH